VGARWRVGSAEESNQLLPNKPLVLTAARPGGMIVRDHMRSSTTLGDVETSTFDTARPAANASAPLRRGGRVCSTAPEPLGSRKA